MAVFAIEPKFLYPKLRQFPFDEVVERIVKALEARNWAVPGLTVKFYDYGSGLTKYRQVNEIKGAGFRLHFSRIQENMGRWNDIAAVSTLFIPKQELHVY